ncbi:hypothetical protein PAPYR_6214 [Paratrimastix pyriformis]|uniref:Uncharacterized protein n=1 Tax=Paratrimastix pyriformis TaxID=342808 RepID=A0ABQ8UJI3_9EUKA|nr:hypothetical protein PAPYR_6214 [Paratrimastix pyriformis]
MHLPAVRVLPPPGAQPPPESESGGDPSSADALPKASGSSDAGDGDGTAAGAAGGEGGPAGDDEDDEDDFVVRDEGEDPLAAAVEDDRPEDRTELLEMEDGVREVAERRVGFQQILRRFVSGDILKHIVYLLGFAGTNPVYLNEACVALLSVICDPGNQRPDALLAPVPTTLTAEQDVVTLGKTCYYGHLYQVSYMYTFLTLLTQQRGLGGPVVDRFARVYAHGFAQALKNEPSLGVEALFHVVPSDSRAQTARILAHMEGPLAASKRGRAGGKGAEASAEGENQNASNDDALTGTDYATSLLTQLCFQPSNSAGMCSTKLSHGGMVLPHKVEVRLTQGVPPQTMSRTCFLCSPLILDGLQVSRHLAAMSRIGAPHATPFYLLLHPLSFVLSLSSFSLTLHQSLSCHNLGSGSASVLGWGRLRDLQTVVIKTGGSPLGSAFARQGVLNVWGDEQDATTRRVVAQYRGEGDLRRPSDLVDLVMAALDDRFERSMVRRKILELCGPDALTLPAPTTQRQRRLRKRAEEAAIAEPPSTESMETQQPDAEAEPTAPQQQKQQQQGAAESKKEGEEGERGWTQAELGQLRQAWAQLMARIERQQGQQGQQEQQQPPTTAPPASMSPEEFCQSLAASLAPHSSASVRMQIRRLGLHLPGEHPPAPRRQTAPRWSPAELAQLRELHAGLIGRGKDDAGTEPLSVAISRGMQGARTPEQVARKLRVLGLALKAGGDGGGEAAAAEAAVPSERKGSEHPTWSPAEDALLREEWTRLDTAADPALCVTLSQSMGVLSQEVDEEVHPRSPLAVRARLGQLGLAYPQLLSDEWNAEWDAALRRAAGAAAAQQRPAGDEVGHPPTDPTARQQTATEGSKQQPSSSPSSQLPSPPLPAQQQPGTGSSDSSLLPSPPVPPPPTLTQPQQDASGPAQQPSAADEGAALAGVHLELGGNAPLDLKLEPTQDEHPESHKTDASAPAPPVPPPPPLTSELLARAGNALPMFSEAQIRRRLVTLGLVTAPPAETQQQKPKQIAGAGARRVTILLDDDDDEEEEEKGKKKAAKKTKRAPRRRDEATERPKLRKTDPAPSSGDEAAEEEDQGAKPKASGNALDQLLGDEDGDALDANDDSSEDPEATGDPRARSVAAALARQKQARAERERQLAGVRQRLDQLMGVSLGPADQPPEVSQELAALLDGHPAAAPATTARGDVAHQQEVGDDDDEDKARVVHETRAAADVGFSKDVTGAGHLAIDVPCTRF